MSPLRYRAIPLLVACLAVTACSSDGDAVVDHHDHGEDAEDDIGSTSSALVASDPVSAAIAAGCSASPAKPLMEQLLGELECLRPNTMKRIDDKPGIVLASSAKISPYLQTGAANALIAAQKARGVTININSGLRTLVHQYMLYRFFRKGCPGLFNPAFPGTSNHESGLAIDINESAAWRSALTGRQFKWLGASDPVHYDYKGPGTVNLSGLSVRAFQRLWNRNNPNDQIAEDGSFGPITEARLAKSPIGGFPKGPTCGVVPDVDAGADAGADAAPPPADEELTEEPPTEEAPPTTKSAPETIAPEPELDPESSEGCSVAKSSGGSASSALAAMLGCAALLRPLLRRRRER